MVEATTLVTFMLHHPTAYHVELLGSWDNFSEPWEMKRDSRRGWGHWAGCHKFRDIICDGDAAGLHEKRDGGLKMGGTYWYYYRIDRDEEYHDPFRQSTSTCPLLPGQYLNVLEVPWEQRYVSRSRTSSVSLITEFQTLNPDHRYMNPRPVPKPKLPKLMTRLHDSEMRAWSAAEPASAHSASGHRPVKSASSLPANFFARIERLRSPIAAALSPTGDGSVRGKIVHPDHIRAQSIRDWQNSSATTSVAGTTPRLLSPASSSSTDAIELPKRRDAYHRTVQRLLDGENFSASIERRAVTVGENRKFGQSTHRRAYSYEHNARSKTSGGNVRDPSPLGRGRNAALSPTAMQIPEGIAEADETLASPGKQRAVSAAASYPPTPILKQSEVAEPSSTLPGKAYVNKELPALPSYLMPEPLFAAFGRGEDKTRGPMGSPKEESVSRFSAWTMTSGGYNEDDWTTEEADGSSPTFSSVRDDSLSLSGHTSPMIRFSNPFSGAKTNSQHVAKHDEVAPRETTKAQEMDAAGWQLQGPLDVADEAARKEMTPMEQLLDEFDYLGAALL